MNPLFFGLDGHPFERAEDTGDVFLSDAHEALYAELHAGLKAPHGITLLIGDEGSGKSSLARAFAAQLADTATVAYLPTVGPGLRHLLTEIIEQLGGSESAAGEEQVLLDELGRLARARAEHGRTTLIILDDAHELPAKTIERLGKLFGDDPAEPSMLHIILVGRGELLDRMNAANDRSILKHLVQVCRMDPIGPEDSFRYIAERITKVGGAVDALFTEDALQMIVRRANGFPARIDAICSASLSCAEGRGEPNVDTEVVDMACAGADSFGGSEPNNDNGNESGASSYFLSDDDDEGDTSGDFDMENEPISSVAAGEAGSRRRLLVWAAGLIVVVAAFAATMTRESDDEQTAATAVTEEEAVQVAAADAPPAEPASSRPQRAVTAEPVAVPKLTISKSSSRSAPESAADAKNADGSDKKRGLDALPRDTAPRRATAPVHAAPSGPAEATAAAAGAAAAVGLNGADARPRIQSPPYKPAAEATAAGSQAAASARATAKAASAREAARAERVAKAARAAARPAAAPAAASPIAQKPQAAAPREVAATMKPAPIVRPQAQPAAPTRIAAAPKPAATPATGTYFTVQLGAFGSRSNAETLLAKVRAKYSDARILTEMASGKPIFRVVSGSFTSMGDAKGRASALDIAGFNTYVRKVSN